MPSKIRYQQIIDTVQTSNKMTTQLNSALEAKTVMKQCIGTTLLPRSGRHANHVPGKTMGPPSDFVGIKKRSNNSETNNMGGTLEVCICIPRR